MANGIQVALERREDGMLWLCYDLECELNSLEIADPDAPVRTDGLWKSTCFELFLRREKHDAYLEYNFSPSSQWAAYQFSEYRSGMAELVTLRPQIYHDASETHFALEVELPIPEDWREDALQVGLSAVVAETGDNISYWALAHPPGKPDFHHRDCFALYLEAPSAA